MAKAGEPMELKDRVREAVERVIDPETGMTMGEMGLITDVREEELGVLRVEFTPSSPFCPIAFRLALDIKRAAMKVEGVKKALVFCRGHMMEEAINRIVNKP